MAQRAKIKVKVEALIAAIEAASQREQTRWEAQKQRASLAQAEKAAEHQRQAEEYLSMTVEQFMEQDHRFRRTGRLDHQKQIAMLRCAAEDTITIDSESDLAAYL